MGAPNATRETAADSVTDLGTWISMHTADPGTTGANEATGGGYAREQTTWSAGASDGNITGSEVEVTVAAGTYTHMGIWSAESGGTFIIGGPLSSSAVLVSGGVIRHTPTVAATAP